MKDKENIPSNNGSGGCIVGIVVIGIIGILLVPELKVLIVIVGLAVIIGLVGSANKW